MIKVQGTIVCEEKDCGREEAITLTLTSSNALSYQLPDGWSKYDYVTCPKHPKRGATLATHGGRRY